MLDSERNYVAHRRWAIPELRDDTPHWWHPTLVTLGVVYGVLTLLILVGSPVNAVDAQLYQLHLVPESSHWHLLVETWVFFGQRAPAMVIAGAYVAYRCRQMRSAEPVVMFLLGSALFVITVAIFKYSTGRFGPRFTSDAYAVFAGGHIFPSGHVAGAVVMYGLMAIIASRSHRRVMLAGAIIMSLTVGAGTVALNTHWASDVVGGWLDGVMVLMVTWAVTPWAHALATGTVQRLRRRGQLPPRTADAPATPDEPRPTHGAQRPQTDLPG